MRASMKHSHCKTQVVKRFPGRELVRLCLLSLTIALQDRQSGGRRSYHFEWPRCRAIGVGSANARRRRPGMLLLFHRSYCQGDYPMRNLKAMKLFAAAALRPTSFAMEHFRSSITRRALRQPRYRPPNWHQSEWCDRAGADRLTTIKSTASSLASKPISKGPVSRNLQLG